MKLNDYQKQTGETAVYPGANSQGWNAISYLGLGLGEAGEIQGKIKKIARDDEYKISTNARRQIAGELGDLLWYVARLSDELNFDLEEIAENNLVKLRDRKARNVIGGSGDER